MYCGFSPRLVAATIVTALLLPSPSGRRRDFRPWGPAEQTGTGAERLLSSRRFLLFLLCSLFSGLAIQTISVFASVCQQCGRGHPAGGADHVRRRHFGLFPFFLAVQLQRRLGIYRVLQLSMGIYLFQYLFLFLARNPWQVMFRCCFRAGLRPVSAGLRVFAHEEAPEELRPRPSPCPIRCSRGGGRHGGARRWAGCSLTDLASAPFRSAPRFSWFYPFSFLTQLRRSSRRREKIPGR